MAAALDWTKADWIELAETDSTNAEAMRRAPTAGARVLYIRADRQTAGRGRSGRPWQTLDGNLALSRLAPLTCPPMAVPQLSLVVGVAIHRAVAWTLGDDECPPRLHLKWPNDLLLDRAKIAGILVEASTVGATRLAVIGIGINIAHAPALAGRRTAALMGSAVRIDSPRMVASLVAGQLEQALAVWNDGAGFDTIRGEWLARSLPVGEPMAIHRGDRRVHGEFSGLAADGSLVLREADGRLQTYAYGDVTLSADTHAGETG